MDNFLDYFKNTKNLIGLLVLGILILAIPIGINLLRQQQILKSRAAEEPITFAAPSGSTVTLRNGNWVSTTPKVKVILKSPLGPAASPTP